MLFIFNGKSMLNLDSGHLSFESTSGSDASLSLQGQLGSQSTLHSAEATSSHCVLRYNEFGTSTEWTTLASIDGVTANTHDSASDAGMTFHFRDTHFSALRHLLYDLAWNRPTGASIDCEIGVQVYMYRFVPVSGTVRLSATASAPTAQTATLSFASSGELGGHTLFESLSSSQVNRSSLNPQTVLSYLTSLHSQAGQSNNQPHQVLASVLGLFNHSSAKEVAVDYTMNNPFYNAQSVPLSSFTVSVPATTVAATALGDAEAGGRFFLTASAFQLELMQPTLRLQTELSLGCSDAFLADDDAEVVVTHCAMPGPSQTVSFYNALFGQRVHLVADAVTSNFVTNLAGRHHTLITEITNATQTDAAFQERLEAIHSRRGTPASARRLTQMQTLEGLDIHFLGYGVSTKGSCMTFDADNALQLFGCAHLSNGLMSYRFHMLNEEEVLLASSLRHAWAPSGTAEVSTELKVSMSENTTIWWNSTISEGQQRSTFEFAVREYRDALLASRMDVDWDFTGGDTAAHTLDLRGILYGKEMEDIHVLSELRVVNDSFAHHAGLMQNDTEFLGASSFGQLGIYHDSV